MPVCHLLGRCGEKWMGVVFGKRFSISLARSDAKELNMRYFCKWWKFCQCKRRRRWILRRAWCRGWLSQIVSLGSSETCSPPIETESETRGGLAGWSNIRVALAECLAAVRRGTSDFIWMWREGAQIELHAQKSVILHASGRCWCQIKDTFEACTKSPFWLEPKGVKVISPPLAAIRRWPHIQEASWWGVWLSSDSPAVAVSPDSSCSLRRKRSCGLMMRWSSLNSCCAVA